MKMEAQEVQESKMSSEYKVVGIIKLPNKRTKEVSALVKDETEEEIYAQLWTEDSIKLGGYLDDILIIKHREKK